MSARDQIEGRRAVLEALRAGRRLHRILIADSVRSAGVVREIRRFAAESGVPVQVVARAVVDRKAQSRAPQGVIALAEPFGFTSETELLKRAAADGQPALLVALDGVTDPHNVGALARSAEAAGAHGLLLPERRSAGVTPAVEKAAAGALSVLPVARVGSLAECLQRMKQRGLWIVALDASGAQTVWELPVADEPLVLVVGAEGRGVSRLILQRADVVARIPMAGRVESLNASVAGAVALFEILRHRSRQHGDVSDS